LTATAGFSFKFIPPAFARAPGLALGMSPIETNWRLERAAHIRSARVFNSDINLFRYRQGVIDLDTEIPDGALDLGVPEQS
jgi:hypothetical protein